MKFFFKVAVLANMCFLISVVMRYVELHAENVAADSLIPLAPVQNVVVILGYSSILINALWLFAWLISTLLASKPVIGRRAVFIISIFLIIQSVYFIFLP